MTGSPDRPLVLVIEDDLRYVRQLRADLELCDCEAVVAGTGARGLDLCASEQPDVVLLDLGLPDADALTVLRRVRATCDAPVVAMTLAEDDDGISGALEVGADDYLAKPFDLDQLLARLRAVLWRAPGAQAGALPPFESDELCIDFASAEVAVGGRPVAMSASEFRLLRFLARNRDRVFTPAQLGGGGLGAGVRGRPASGAGVRAAGAAEDRIQSRRSAAPGNETGGGLRAARHD